MFSYISRGKNNEAVGLYPTFLAQEISGEKQ